MPKGARRNAPRHRRRTGSMDERKQENPHGYGVKYEKMLSSVYSNRALCELLRLVGALAVLFSVFVLGVLLATSQPRRAVELAAVTVIPFIAVSVTRRLIDAPRPYELFAIFDSAPKKKKGEGFPSRHVFSAFLIATVCLPTLPVLSAVLFVLASAMAVSRVLLGIHFVRDVVAGAIIGALSGGIGLLVLFLI